MFCDSIKARLHPQDVVWIHDYHLMLLPGLLRTDTSPALSVVFYLHIPFPTSQIFRSLPSASTVMKSLLQADVVGFHTYQYARHFLNSGQRTVGATSHTLPGGLFSIVSQGREVVLSMSVVSVEPLRMDAALADPSVHEAAAALRARYPGKKLICAVDLRQRLSGGVYKLAALECFLDEFRGPKQAEVVLVLRAVQSSARINDELQTSAELTAMALRLNAKYGRVVVDYEEPLEFSLKQRVALWLAGDVFLNTAVREGLHMNAMEFIYARREHRAGVVVLSDMSAAASLLNGSIKVGV
jgi:trehalose 6-phosphate synthase/phosphatase